MTVILAHPTAARVALMVAAVVVGLVVGFATTPNVPENTNEAGGSSSPEAAPTSSMEGV